MGVSRTSWLKASKASPRNLDLMFQNSGNPLQVLEQRSSRVKADLDQFARWTEARLVSSQGGKEEIRVLVWEQSDKGRAWAGRTVVVMKKKSECEIYRITKSVYAYSTHTCLSYTHNACVLLHLTLTACCLYPECTENEGRERPREGWSDAV